MHNKQLYRYFLILWLLPGASCFGQKYNGDSLFQKFRNDIQMEQERTGRVVWDDETKETFWTFMAGQTSKTLVKYADDSIPAVRAEIFVGLLQTKADERTLLKIQKRHLNDTAKFTTGSDYVINWSVKGYMQFVQEMKAQYRPMNYKACIAKLKERQSELVVPGAHHGFISKDSLLRLDRLIFRMPGINILSFTLNTETTSLTVNGVFTEREKAVMAQLKPGDWIAFDGIKGSGPDKSVRQLGSILLKVR